MGTTTMEKIDITHDKLKNSLQNYMRIMGTRGYFKHSETLEKRIENMKLVFMDGNSCYTDFKAVFIGLFFTYIKDCKSLDEKYNMARIIIAHEVAHLRFTRQKTWNSYCHSSHGKYKKLSRYSIDILNIVEDGRIEYHMSKISPKVKRGFKYLRHLMAKNIEKQFNEIKPGKEMTSSEMLTHILNGVLYIVCTLNVPKVPNKVVTGYLEEIWPLVVYSRKTKSTEKAVTVAEKIMEIISPLREEFEVKSEEKMKGTYSSKSSGSEDAMEEDDIEDMESVLEPEDVDDDLPEEVKEVLEKLEEIAEEMLGEEDKEVKDDKSEDSFEKEALSSSEVFDDSEEGIKEEFEDEDDDKFTLKSKEKLDESDSKDDESEKTSSSKETTQTLKEVMDELKEKFEEYKDEIEESKKETTEEIKKEHAEPITADILNDYLNKDSKSKKEGLSEKKEEKKILSLDPYFDKVLHSGCEVEFKPKKYQAKFTPFEYSKLSEPILPLAKKTAKELKKLSNYQLESTLRFQRRGRLDRRSIVNIAATKETKGFRKKQVDVVQMSMDVLLLVDGSGSKGCRISNPKNDVVLARYEMDRIVSMFLHETLKQVKFPHAVWWFDEQFHTRKERFSSMIDFDNCFRKDASLHLKDISAYDDNRDGFSISYAGEYLRKSGSNNKKLLIVLSDGAPAANNYHGSNAINDVAKTIEDLEAKGVKTIGIFTGDETENPIFKTMYKNHLFVNNESMFNLPEELKKILVREFKDHLNTL